MVLILTSYFKIYCICYFLYTVAFTQYA